MRSRDTGEPIQKRRRQAESAAKSEDIETVNGSLLWLNCVLFVLVVLFCVSYWFYWKDVVGMRVMALNTWGMPHTLGSQDKEERMAAIGRLIGGGEYDMVMLSELWMRPDHATIKKVVEENGLHMTAYDDLTTGCDGNVGPWGCSGLAVVSHRAEELHQVQQAGKI